MQCPVCNKGEIILYEPGEMAYHLTDTGEATHPMFVPDSTDNWVQCNNCLASDTGYNGPAILEANYNPPITVRRNDNG